MVKFNWKKKAAKALVFAMVMGTASVHGVSLNAPVAAIAAEGDTGKEESKVPVLSIGYGGVRIESKNDDDKYLFLEVLKDKEGTKTVSGPYCFEKGSDGAVNVDLSFLKTSKDNYLRAYGDADMKAKSEILVIGAQPKKTAIKYVGGTDDVLKSFTIGGSAATVEALSDYRISTLYGEVSFLNYTADGKWELNDKAADTLKQLKITGTTLIFRQESSTEYEKEGDPASKVTKYTPGGPEIKVKVPAIAKAPKVTVDYLKGTVKLTDKVEYSLVGATKEVGEGEKKTTEQTWIKGQKDPLTPVDIIIKVFDLKDTGEGDAKKTAAEQAQEKLKDGVTLMVRTAADTSKKKDASQATFIALKAVPSVKDDAAKSQVSVQDFEDGKDATKYLKYENTEKGVKVTATGVGFDYSIDSGKTWKSVKAGSTATVKSTAFMVRTSGVKADTKKNTEGADGAFPSEAVSVIVPALKPTYSNLVVTASKGNTLTFSANPGDSKYKATVAGTAAYQYRAEADKEKDDAWAAIPSDGLAAGKYEIRVAEVKDKTAASAAVEIELPAIPTPTPSPAA